MKMRIVLSLHKTIYLTATLIAVLITIYVKITYDGNHLLGEKLVTGNISNARARQRLSIANHKNVEMRVNKNLEENIGLVMLENMFQLFDQNQSECSKLLLEKISMNGDPRAMRALGYCCGRSGRASWLTWLHANLTDDQYHSAKIGYFEGLAMIGSFAVIEQWEKLDDDYTERDVLISVALLVLCEKDVQDAEELLYYWVEKNPNRLWAKNPAVIKVLAMLFERIDFVSEDFLNNDRFLTLCQGNIGRVAMEIAKVDFNRAREWALARDGVSEKIAAVKGVLLTEAATKDNYEVMQTIIELGESGKVPVGNMIRDVLLFKLDKDIAEAEEWIDVIGEKHITYDQCCGAFVARWAAEDQLAVSKWISELPAGRKRDISAFYLASDLKSPIDAVDWASAIGDDRLRGSLLRQIIVKFNQDEILNVFLDLDIAAKLSAADLETLNSESMR